VLIDRRNHHIFQPLLYQVATAVLAPSEVAAPIRRLSRRQQNISVILGEVSGIDLASHLVQVRCEAVGIRVVAFDYLILAPGMQPKRFRP
jgi:NADH dehydrogenase